MNFEVLGYVILCLVCWSVCSISNCWCFISIVFQACT